MAQCKSGLRMPKAEVIESLAGILGVSLQALDIPDIDSFPRFIVLFHWGMFGAAEKKTKYISFLAEASRILTVPFSKCSPLEHSR